MDIIIDGNLIKDKNQLFDLLKQQINSDEFYSSNLDALWDVLNQSHYHINFKIKNALKLKENIHDYYDALITTLSDLAYENQSITLQISLFND